MGKPPPSRTADTRTRLLNSLGLFQEENQRRLDNKRPSTLFKDGLNADGSETPQVSSPTTENQASRHTRRWSDMPMSALRNSIVFETQLKDHEADRHKSSFFKSTNNHNKRGHRKTQSMVRFSTVVSCVQIPSRSQYSKRIKQTLWRDREELSEMVERNTEEFRAENYDWKNAVLDEDMFLNADNGELVHPCHVSDDMLLMYDSDSTTDNGEQDANDNVDTTSQNEDDSSFVPLGQMGKSTWEVL
jgi:hypothetical protein